MAEGGAAQGASGGTITPGGTGGNGQIKPLSDAPAGRVTALDLADSAFARLGEGFGKKLSKGKDPAAQAKGAAPAQPAKAKEPEWIKPPPGQEEELEDPDDIDSALNAGGEDEPSVEPAPEDKWGSAEEPWTVSDLPEDRFVRVKVDGEWQTIPLREAVDGGIRLQTMTKRVSQAQNIVDQAKGVMAHAEQKVNLIHQAARDIFGDPEQIYDVMMTAHPQVLEAIAKKFAMHKLRCEREPGYEARSVQERYEARLRKQQEQQERARMGQEQQRQAQEARARAEATLRPGYDAGLKEAGFPKQTDEFRRMVRTMLQMHEQETGQITADDVRQAVVKAAHFLQLPKATAAENKPRKFELKKPGADVAQAPSQDKNRRKRNGRSDAPTVYQRSVDSLLSGIKA